jgi:hypothetical protein
MPCCGDPVPTPRSTRRRIGLPRNPSVANGVALVFLGGGRTVLKGRGSGLTYYVSEHRRHFVARPEDLPDILADPAFMKEP